MQRGEESALLETLKRLAEERAPLFHRRKAALESGDAAALLEVERRLEAIQRAMAPAFGELHAGYNHRMLLQAKHSTRSPEAAADVAQEAWHRFDLALEKFNLDYPAFPLLSKCVRHAAADFYTSPWARHEVQAGDSGTLENQDCTCGPSDLSPSVEPMPASEDYFFILNFAMSREGGPAHERLSFGFRKLLELPLGDIVRTYRPNELETMTQDLLGGYIRESGLPPDRVRPAFQSLIEDLPQTLRTVDPKTAAKFRDTVLPGLPLGKGRYGTYLPSAREEAEAGHWIDNVMKRLKNTPKVQARRRIVNRRQA